MGSIDSGSALRSLVVFDVTSAGAVDLSDPTFFVVDGSLDSGPVEDLILITRGPTLEGRGVPPLVVMAAEAFASGNEFLILIILDAEASTLDFEPATDTSTPAASEELVPVFWAVEILGGGRISRLSRTDDEVIVVTGTGWSGFVEGEGDFGRAGVPAFLLVLGVVSDVIVVAIVVAAVVDSAMSDSVGAGTIDLLVLQLVPVLLLLASDSSVTSFVSGIEMGSLLLIANLSLLVRIKGVEISWHGVL
jgi:hypothetical protein